MVDVRWRPMSKYLNNNNNSYISNGQIKNITCVGIYIYLPILIGNV